MPKLDSKKLLKTLTAGRGAILVPHINEYQRKGNFPEHFSFTMDGAKKDDGFFHPSTDAFLKPSILWLARKNLLKKTSITYNLQRTFHVGHFWHYYFGTILTDMKLVHPDNVELYTSVEREGTYGKLMAAGTGDLVGVNIPGHGDWLVDMKTMNKAEFEAGASAFRMKKWEAQVNCYGDWFGYDKMMILAICKDSPHELREYQIQKSQIVLDDIYDRWSYVQYCLDTGVEPDDNYREPLVELVESDSGED